MSIEIFYLRFLKIFLPLFVLTLPLANRDIFSVFLNRLFPVRIILVAVILVGFLVGLANFFQKPAKALWLKNVASELYRDFVFKLLAGLWLVRLVSLKDTLNLGASLNLLLFYSSVVALYLILKFVYRRQGLLLIKVWRLHLFTVSLVALYGLVQLLTPLFGLRLPGVLLGSTFVRIPATFYDANHLPVYLLTALPVLFVFFFAAKREATRFLLAALLGIFSLVFLFSFSRSGFLATATAFIWLTLFFLRRRYWQKLLILFYVFLLGSGIIYLTAQTQFSLLTRLTSPFNLSDRSTVSHGLLIYGSFELLKKSPLFGLGYGSFSEHFRASPVGRQHAFFDETAAAANVRLPAHSLWLEVLVETGILGASLYLWFVLVVIETAGRALKSLQDKWASLYQAALLASFVGILVGGLFYSYNLEFFWFFVFLLYFQSLGVIDRRPEFFPTNRVLPETIPEAATASEAIDRRFWLTFWAAILMSASLLLSGLDRRPVQPGVEGLLATASKDLRRDWGYGTLNWWRPKYQDRVLWEAPLPIWLNSVWIFLYDFGPAVVRFLPAFFGLLGLLILFVSLVGRRRQFELGFRGLLLCLAWPGFLFLVRSNSSLGLFFFLTCLVIFLAEKILVEDKKFYRPLWWLCLALLGLSTYLGFFLASLGLLLKAKSRRHFLEVALAVTTAFLPAFFWLLSLKKFLPASELVSGLGRSSDFLQPNLLGLIIFAGLAFCLPRLAGLCAKVPARIFYLGLGSMILIWFSLSFRESNNLNVVGMIGQRMVRSRDGRLPLYTTFLPGSDVFYYSDVSTAYRSLNEISRQLGSQDFFYAIVDGEEARELWQNERRSFNVVIGSGPLVLLEKPGKIN